MRFTNSRVRTTSAANQPKQPAVIGGWVCMVIG